MNTWKPSFEDFSSISGHLIGVLKLVEIFNTDINFNHLHVGNLSSISLSPLRVLGQLQ